MKKLSELYHISRRGNMRNEASKGFVRPTIKQVWAPYKKYFNGAQSFVGRIIFPSSDVQEFKDSISLNEAGEYTLIPNINFNAVCKLWGAAGGGKSGGPGGYASGKVEFQKDQTYIIYVAGPGTISPTVSHGAEGGFGGGGFSGRPDCDNPKFNIGSGGGLTGLFQNSVLQSNAVLIAGGGGGGLPNFNGTYEGGPGGGLTGIKGTSAYPLVSGGEGGTQTHGGKKGYYAYSYDAGTTDGSALHGGNGASSLTRIYSGGGGGAGYFGGGGGGGNNYSGAPGGGGSSFINSPLVTDGVTMHEEIGSVVAPNNSDPDYKNNAGAVSPNNIIVYPGLFVINVI